MSIVGWYWISTDQIDQSDVGCDFSLGTNIGTTLSNVPTHFRRPASTVKKNYCYRQNIADTDPCTALCLLTIASWEYNLFDHQLYSNLIQYPDDYIILSIYSLYPCNLISRASLYCKIFVNYILYLYNMTWIKNKLKD